MSQETINEQIAAALAVDCKLLKSLNEQLAKEKDALTKHDVALIESITVEKSAVLEKIAESEESRKVLFNTAGIEASSDAFQQYLSTCSSSDKDKLQSVYIEMKKLLKICHDANIVNGMLLNLTAFNNQRLLDVLQGKDATEDSEAYDKSGKIQRSRSDDRDVA